MNDQSFKAFQRVSTSLQHAGIPDEQAAEIVGKATMVITEKVLEELNACVEQFDTAQMEGKSDEEKEQMVLKAFEEKHGMSVSEYREQMAEKWVQDFEAAA